MKTKCFKVVFPFVMFLCLACHEQNNKTLFTLLPASQTGITFNNAISTSDTFNVLTFEYLYNGGGVGAGDVNNDGLTDLFFAGNMVSCQLYLNKGNFKFQEVTLPAGVQTNVWCTGIAMVDINHDGLTDIHVSTVQPLPNGPPVANIFFVNKGVDANGIPSFENKAAEMGLADQSYATQAAFLDYDLDGDLDLYLLNNALENYNRNLPVGQQHNGKGKSVDKLYRNTGKNTNGLPVFTDVSATAGILSEGWGLGVVVNDINQDGYPDVYAANDFLSNDHLYLNNQDGTFTNTITSMLKHQEHNGMGVDIADINNDGLNDIVVTDMMPEDNLRQKAMFSNIGYDRFWLNRTRNYQDQYVRNVLQLNNGNGTFSDIGYLAGIYATDWSWSCLLADFDNDGYRDLLVTNGYPKDITDLDFVSYRKEASAFGSDKVRMEKMLKEVNALKGVKKPNVLFHNNGDLTFSDKTSVWGLNQPSYSNGAIYADLDNDGDLDIAMNNLDGEAFVYRNNLNGTSVDSTHGFLRVKFVGASGHASALGAKVWLYSGDKRWCAEHQRQRGYKSSVEDVVHIGLGNAKIDSVKIVWPSGRTQMLYNVPANQTVTVQEYNSATIKYNTKEVTPVFMEAHRHHNILYRHREKSFVDFKQGQPLLPHKHSQGGPALAVGDMNGDGLEDFIIGGAAQERATLFYQTSEGSFRRDSLPQKQAEDMGLLLLDADNDDDMDLYCVSGSTEFGNGEQYYQDRFYRNTGKGKFLLDPAALPSTGASGSCVAAADYDRDGDLDLFVGGRIMPGRYPSTPQSYLLQNDGTGKFTDNTQHVSTTLQRAGMITTALWTDFDNDGWFDLVVAGEWMPITFYKNNNGQNFSEIRLPNSVGWWNSITGGDLDNDGDTDYVAGNLGLNTLYKASATEPVSLYASDFDNNNSLDPIMSRYVQGKEYITHPRESLTEQISALRRVLPRYAVYGKLSPQEILQEEKLKKAQVYRATTFTSAWIENRGNGSFLLHTLPVEAQFSPVCGILVTDVNGDRYPDILTVGNNYAAETLTGFYDAGTGTCLLGDGKGNFKTLPLPTAGFYVGGDGKALVSIPVNNHTLFIASQNQDSLKVFRKNLLGKPSSPGHVKLKALDAYAIFQWPDGQKRRQEFYYGAGYLSASRTSENVIGASVTLYTFGNSEQ